MNSILVVFTILLLIALPSAKQKTTGDENEEVYQEIPAEQRGQLKQAVSRLVEAEKAGDWKSVYALTDKKLTESEDKFVSKMKRTRNLREFRPSKVTFMPPDGSWNIQGCASFEGDPKQHGHIADITARWKDSRWYLSPVALVPFGNEKKANFRECSVPELKSASTTWRGGPSMCMPTSAIIRCRRSIPMGGWPSIRAKALSKDSSSPQCWEAQLDSQDG